MMNSWFMMCELNCEFENDNLIIYEVPDLLESLQRRATKQNSNFV